MGIKEQQLKAYQKTYRLQNSERLKIKALEWQKKNKEHKRAYERKRRGLPEPTRPRPNRCELCNGLPNGRGNLHLDHDHETGAFRGWICSTCNTGLGKLGDNLQGLLRAMDYILGLSRK